VKPKFGLNDGQYHFRQPGEDYKKVNVYVDDQDSVRIFEKASPVVINIKEPQYFKKATFDFDAMTVPFKFRPISFSFPRQLDTEFNGNMYLGYRLDRYVVKYRETPIGHRQQLKHIGFSGGFFGGLGSTFISPWTTNYRITDEYYGFIWSRGVALLVGVHNFTFGLGAGWDYLTDRDKDIWIYQNKIWYGLSLSLHVN
jgi:hypothetical protein